MKWGKYIPDGFIKSGSWFVDLPIALGDTISALSYDEKTYIQGVAHGTEMDFNFHEGQADCYNPTEPGAWDDDITAKWGAGWNQFPGWDRAPRRSSPRRRTRPRPR
jgi:hypothetical protein